MGRISWSDERSSAAWWLAPSGEREFRCCGERRPSRACVGTRDLIYAPGVETVSAFIPRDPQACYRAFTDARQLASWVPGLTRADILTKVRGLADEVHFEFASELAYTLVYAYDPAKQQVSWRPKIGAEEGVTGFARFEAAPGGTQFTYGLEQGEARTPDEQELGNLHAIVAAFVGWMQR
jgi:uncharacterized protein YndB with AHSA1/START domain